MKKYYMIPGGLACAAVLAFVACEKKPASQGAAPLPSGLVTGEKKSSHFDAVANRLEVGGEYFSYSDISGDADKFVKFLQDTLNIAKERKPEMIPAGVNIDLPAIFDELGLGKLAAIGKSSSVRGQGYHNRVYYYLPEGRTGLFGLYGHDPKPLKLPKNAPADADIAFEQEIYLKPLLSMAQNITKKIGDQSLIDKLDEMIQMPIPALSMKMADLFGKLDSRISVVLRFNQKEMIKLPEKDQEIPSPELMMTLENLGWLKDTLEAELPKAGLVRSEENGEIIYQMKDAAPAPFDKYQPQIRFNPSTGHLTVVSSPAFLNACIGQGGAKLENRPDYAQITADLPKEGNGFFYLKNDFLNRCAELVQKSLAEGMDEKDLEALGRFQKLYEPYLDGAWVGVNRNEPTGIFSAYNAPYSAKLEQFLSGSGIQMLGLIMPAIEKAREKADAQQALMDMPMDSTASATSEGDPTAAGATEEMPDTPETRMQVLNIWTSMYHGANGKYPAKLDDLATLVGEDELAKYKLYKNPTTGEEQPFLYAPVADPKDGVGVPVLAVPEPDEEGNVTVQFSDMEQKKVPLAEFKKIWPRVKK
jgi:hypothetical protein